MHATDPEWKWLSVCLRISSDDLDPDGVTKALGLTPDFTGHKGRHIDGDSSRAVLETNLWGHTCAEEFTEPFEAQLSDFVARLEQRGTQLRALSCRSGVDAELLLGFSSSNGQGGFTLTAELLARISALGLDVTMDLYPAPSEAE